MSDKSKLSYYFTRKSETLLEDSCNTCNSTRKTPDIVNINITIVNKFVLKNNERKILF